MNFEAKVVADSIAPNGVRLTTMTLKMPRFIWAEFMTHRVFSRNAESSRAMPVKKKLDLIEADPVEPVEWGLNRPGMQAAEVLLPEDEARAREWWHAARKAAITSARQLDTLKVHKQVVNRICEPWAAITGVVSSTKWRNFDFLRVHPAADPNIQKLARMRKEAYDASVPKELKDFEWHLPFVTPEDTHLVLQYQNIQSQPLSLDEILKRCSAARCARVSLLNHEGKRPGIDEDLKLFDRLVSRDNPFNDPGHFTPLEHQARPIGGFKIIEGGVDYAGEECPRCTSMSHVSRMTKKQVLFVGHRDPCCMKCALGHITSGNFHGWHQHRKDYAYEDFDA